jgi:hypothetical protein
MNAKKILLAAAGAVFVAAGFVWFDAVRSASEAAAALDAAANARARLTEAVHRADARLAAAEKIQADTQAALDGRRAAKPAAPAPVTPAKPAPAPMAANPRDLLEKDPALQALWLNSGRARLAQEYGPFFATLQLTPAQIEEFTVNMVKRQEQLMDLSGAAQSQGAESKAAVATLQQQATDAYTAAQTALLGTGAFRQLQDYERSAQARLAVEGLVGSATLEGVPLTAGQAAQLTAALANSSSRFAGGGRVDLATVDWDAADAQARQVLTPAQFELFKSTAPLSSGASRWNLQLDAAVGRARQVDAASAPKPPGG